MKKSGQSLQIVENYGYERISSVYAENGRLQVSLLNGARLNFYSKTAEDIEHWIGVFLKSVSLEFLYGIQLTDCVRRF